MMILLVVLLVTASGVALSLTIPHDGYGSRPVPRSHVDSFPLAHRLR